MKKRGQAKKAEDYVGRSQNFWTTKSFSAAVIYWGKFVLCALTDYAEKLEGEPSCDPIHRPQTSQQVVPNAAQHQQVKHLISHSAAVLWSVMWTFYFIIYLFIFSGLKIVYRLVLPEKNFTLKNRSLLLSIYQQTHRLVIFFIFFYFIFFFFKLCHLGNALPFHELRKAAFSVTAIIKLPEMCKKEVRGHIAWRVTEF